MENKTVRPVYENFPHIEPNQPMDETEWWKFLKENRNEITAYFLKDLIRFRPTFCLGVHIFPEEQYHIYKLIYSHFWWCYHHGRLND